MALLGGGGVVAAAVAVLAIVKLGGGGARRSAPAAPVATRRASRRRRWRRRRRRAPEKVDVALKSDPPGAQVVRTDGVIVGVTPVTMKLDKGSPALEVQLSLDGYRSEKRTITSDVNRELDVNLLKERAKRAKPAEARPAEARPKEQKPSDPDKDLIPAQL